MAGTTKLKFKRNLLTHGVTADGYRLATAEEVTNNVELISRHRLPPVKQDLHSSCDVGRTMRVLDGYATYSSNERSLEVESDIKFEWCCMWKVVVKEKELDRTVRKWKTRSSAIYSNDGIVVRKSVYHGISLSQSGRNVALQLAALYCDAEVLYWLLLTASTDEFKLFREALDKMFFGFVDFMGVESSLLTSSFPFHPPTDESLEEDSRGNTIMSLEEDSRGNTVVDYFMELANECLSQGDKWYLMGYVELLVNIYSPKIAYYPNSKGKSFIDLAEAQGLIHVFTKLLTFSDSSHYARIKPHFEKVLAEAIERRYLRLLEVLVDWEDELAHISIDVFLSFLRYAARKDNLICAQKLLDFISKRPISVARDGNVVSFDKPGVIRKLDEFGRNLLHYAAEAPQGLVANYLLQSSISELDLVFSTDYHGKTPLHIAASMNNTKVVRILGEILGVDEFSKYVQQTDSSSRTALQMAAKGGHKQTIEVLLSYGSNPLKERDASGKTALHYAALGKHPKTARSICQILLESCKSLRGRKALLLWANAAGIGTADDMEEVDPSVKTYLRKEKKNVGKVILLQEAVACGEVEMACELINRGAEIADIHDHTWRNKFQDKEENALNDVIKEVVNEFNRMKEQGRDRPSMEDRLGRNLLAGGLASLFLNKFIVSPITVGISGEWGMGKSSLMVQTENIILLTSAQLTFPNLLPFEDFGGARKIILSKRGMGIYEMIKRGASKFFIHAESNKENPLIRVLKDYQPEYHSVYKSLACMDIRQMLQPNVQYSSSERQEYAFGDVPRILTIQYNAWHYTDEHQAWAGLAVSITKEIEKAMTKEQWLSTCWRYSWNKNKANIWLYVLLPCLLATLLSGWVCWGAWMLLRHSKSDKLQYGSIPITIIIIVWVVIKSIISVVQPVSTKMMGYMTSPNRASHLGYQEEVISDINFLKKEIGQKPYRIFSFISGKWWWNWFGLCGDYVENTGIVKFTPASEDQLRIITFVDDLDRCDEKVVLQVLSAISLVLAECKINVILGMDKRMIERAIRRNFEDLDDNDIAEKFISKIIQIPLSLPDSTEEEMQTFLEYQLGRKFRTQQKSRAKWKSLVAVDEALYYSTSDSSDEEQEDVRNLETTVLDIECSTKDRTRGHGIMRKILDYVWKCFSICNKISKQHEDSNSREEKMVLSKGIQLTREMALSKCNQDEADIFLKLMVFATGNQKLPREWKRLLNYHRLAWNVLSKRGQVYSLQTWKEELVAWVFVCWKWKHQMNILIKGWHKYARVASNHDEHKDESSVACHGPSLGRIVKQNLIELEGVEESEGDVGEKRTENMLNVEGSLRQNKLLLYALGHYEENLEKCPTGNWHTLQEALDIQDVSMKGIQLFQQFRLHCETDHLLWPLAK